MSSAEPSLSDKDSEARFEEIFHYISALHWNEFRATADKIPSPATMSKERSARYILFLTAIALAKHEQDRGYVTPSAELLETLTASCRDTVAEFADAFDKIKKVKRDSSYSETLAADTIVLKRLTLSDCEHLLGALGFTVEETRHFGMHRNTMNMRRSDDLPTPKPKKDGIVEHNRLNSSELSESIQFLRGSDREYDSIETKMHSALTALVLPIVRFESSHDALEHDALFDVLVKQARRQTKQDRGSSGAIER